MKSVRYTCITMQNLGFRYILAIGVSCLAIGLSSDIAISLQYGPPSWVVRGLWITVGAACIISRGRWPEYLIPAVVFLFASRGIGFVVLVLGGRLDLVGAVSERILMILLIIWLSILARISIADRV